MTHIHSRFSLSSSSSGKIPGPFPWLITGVPHLECPTRPDPELPISTCNYSAARERLLEKGVKVSSAWPLSSSFSRSRT